MCIQGILFIFRVFNLRGKVDSPQLWVSLLLHVGSIIEKKPHCKEIKDIFTVRQHLALQIAEIGLWQYAFNFILVCKRVFKLMEHTLEYGFYT